VQAIGEADHLDRLVDQEYQEGHGQENRHQQDGIPKRPLHPSPHGARTALPPGAGGAV
jgi:hypothetical protein